MFKHLIVCIALAGAVLQIGTPRLKYYLLACGLFTIPFSYDLTLYRLNVVESFQGWVGGLIFRLSDIFFLLIPLACQKPRLMPCERSSLNWTDQPVLLFLFMACVSMLFPNDRKCAFVAVFQLTLTTFVYYWIVTRYFDWREDQVFLVKCIAAALFFQSCLALWQAYFQNGYDFFRTGSSTRLTLDGEYARSQGTIPQPNGFAAYLHFTLLPLFGVWLLWKSKRRGFLTTALILGVIAMITTLSRGGWLGLAAGALFIAYYRGSMPELRRWILWGIMIVLIVLMLPPVRQRLMGDDDGSAQDRWHLAQIAAGMIRSHPVLGVGINNYRLAMYEFVPADYDWNFIYRVHTLPLLIFAEMGVGGLVAFAFLFWRAISIGARSQIDRSASIGLIATGVGAACLAAIVHGFFDVVWTAPTVNAQFFFTLALGALVRREMEVCAEAVTPEWEVLDATWDDETAGVFRTGVGA